MRPAGAALGARRASAAVLLYLFAGGVGLPVFTGFGYGVTHLTHALASA
ncbi:MAG: biotin transporter BioY [candidate division WOR-3 bacterium]